MYVEKQQELGRPCRFLDGLIASGQGSACSREGEASDDL